MKINSDIYHNNDLINDQFIFYQTSTKQTNISFSLMPINENYPTKIFLKLKGIYSNILENLDELKGKVYEILKDGSIKKKKINDILDFSQLNIFNDIYNNELNIPLKLNNDIKLLMFYLNFEKENNNVEKLAIVGMKHSGSTMIFNILRIAYKKLGKLINENCNDLNFSNVIINKSHTVSEKFIKENYKLITTIRDVRDTSISGFYRFIFQQSINKKENIENEILKYGMTTFIDSMHENICLYYDSLNYSPIEFIYENYKNDPIESIQRLFESINIYNDIDFVKSCIDEVNKIKDDENLLNNLTEWKNDYEKSLDKLLTKDHNTSNGSIKKYESFFNEKQNNLILEDPFIKNFLESKNFI